MQNRKPKNKLSAGISDLFYVWSHEISNIFKDSAVVIFFFLVPLAYPLIYSFIYNNEVVHDVPLAIVDNSRSSLSREFSRKMDASPDVEVVSYCANKEEAIELINEKKAFGLMLIPSSFSKDAIEGRQTTIELYCDMSCLLFYKSFLLIGTEVSMEMGNKIRFSQNAEGSKKLEDITAEPIPYEAITMFNTQSGFASFLIPGVLVLIIQQTLLLGICLMGGTTRERSRFKCLIPVDKHYHGVFRVLFGKALAYIIVYVVVCVWVLLAVPHLFNLPQLGDLGTITVFILPYLFACVFMSMTFSGFVTSRESPMLIFVFTSVIFIFISGISWPWSEIPWFWQTVGCLFPSTPGIQGFVRINTMGATLSDVSSEYTLLWLQSLAYFFAAYAVYFRQIKLLKNRTLEARKSHTSSENLVSAPTDAKSSQ